MLQLYRGGISLRTYFVMRSFELDEFMGGQIGTEAWADKFFDKIRERGLPQVRSLVDASPEVQRLVCGQLVAPLGPKL